MKRDDTKTSSVIVKFYRGESPDAQGRMIDDIRNWNHQRLEYTHDYIQWLFPLRERSQFNWSAPTLSDVDIRAFHTDEDLRKQLVRSFDVMLSFYGFVQQRIGTKTVITRAENWEQRRKVWLNPGNHNFLRITRILTALRLLGLPEYAIAFFGALSDVYGSGAKSVIGSVSFGYWDRAANGPNMA
jgi:opioid growth factor receptor-like protein